MYRAMIAKNRVCQPRGYTSVAIFKLYCAKISAVIKFVTNVTKCNQGFNFYWLKQE